MDRDVEASAEGSGTYLPPHLRRRASGNRLHEKTTARFSRHGLNRDMAASSKDIEEKLFGTDSGSLSGINFHKYQDIPVEISGFDPPSPIEGFEDLAIHPLVQENISLARYTVATPIQKYSVSVVGEQRDLMACAQTGSGKTAAFLIPIISKLLKDSPRARQVSTDYKKGYPLALIVAPTRELATQIYNEALKFAYRSWIKCLVIYGGVDYRTQTRDIHRVDIVVATPGRLLDILLRDRLSLAHIQYFVLDEADRMLDMGFEPDIRKIVGEFDMPIKVRRNTLMYSATFPKEIQKLASDFLDNYLFLSVGKVGSTSENIQQRIELVEEGDKRSVLLDVLHSIYGEDKQHSQDRTLIFVEKKATVDILGAFLRREGFHIASIHGDKTQEEREESLNKFRSGKSSILVATAVASRGLDISNVTEVIVHDFPSDIDEYVHRIGRTGRAGNLGRSLAFFTPANKNLAKDLTTVLKEASQPVPDWLLKMAERHVQTKKNAKPFRDHRKKGYGTRGIY